jgi:hypothetical protein
VQNNGSAYDLFPPSYDASLAEVGRSTPSGEMLRRYWRRLREMIELVRGGGDPINLDFSGNAMATVRAGNFIASDVAAA